VRETLDISSEPKAAGRNDAEKIQNRSGYSGSFMGAEMIRWTSGKCAQGKKRTELLQSALRAKGGGGDIVKVRWRQQVRQLTDHATNL